MMSMTSGVSRRQMLSMMSGMTTCALIAPVKTLAEEEKKKKGQKGTKEAKGYQLCMSQCLYDCTTPKAGPAKERTECRVECKDECAISREQL